MRSNEIIKRSNNTHAYYCNHVSDRVDVISSKSQSQPKCKNGAHYNYNKKISKKKDVNN